MLFQLNHEREAHADENHKMSSMVEELSATRRRLATYQRQAAEAREEAAQVISVFVVVPSLLPSYFTEFAELLVGRGYLVVCHGSALGRQAPS